MLEIPWPLSTCAVRVKRCRVTMIVQWCADEGGFIGMAFADGQPVLPELVGPCATVSQAEARTVRVLYRLGLWR